MIPLILFPVLQAAIQVVPQTHLQMRRSFNYRWQANLLRAKMPLLHQGQRVQELQVQGMQEQSRNELTNLFPNRIIVFSLAKFPFEKMAFEFVIGVGLSLPKVVFEPIS